MGHIYGLCCFKSLFYVEDVFVFFYVEDLAYLYNLLFLRHFSFPLPPVDPHLASGDSSLGISWVSTISSEFHDMLEALPELVESIPPLATEGLGSGLLT